MKVDRKDVNVYDLRSAIELLKNDKNELVYTNIEVDPHGELAGIYRHVGAGGTVKRPTKIGPAMIFNNVKKHGDSKVLIGLFSNRERVSKLIGCKPDQLGFLLNEAVKDAIAPITIENKDAKCQEVVHYATDEDFDIKKYYLHQQIL